MDHATRPEVLPEVREVLFARVVRKFRLLFSIQVVQVAEKLIEPVIRRQMLVLIAEVVLAKLSGRVSEWLEQFSNRWIFLAQTRFRTRHSHLTEAGTKHTLSSDERRSTGCARLLAIGIGEAHTFVRDAVDVGRAIAHH